VSIFDEFSNRYSGRFFGKYRGVVSRIDDPKKMGRIMAKVPVVLGTEHAVGWALPTPPVGGGRNVGFIAHPAVGDYVWIEFEEGDPEKSLWSAGPWPLGAQKQSFMPKHGKGEADSTDYSMREFGNVPPSQFQGQYGSVVCLQGHDGSFLEFDGTEGAHRVQLSHYSGTRIEMTAEGSYQEAVVGQTVRRSAGNSNTEIGGNEIETVCGNRVGRINGTTLETYSKGSSQLFGMRLLNYPGLNPDEIPAEYQDSFVDPVSGDPIYIPANLRQKGGSYTGIWDNSVLYTVGGQFSINAGGNMDLVCGSGFSLMSMTGLQLVASEGLELTGMATTYGDTSLNTTSIKPVVIYGYNGVSEVVSFDVTGLASCSGVIADPGGATRKPSPQPIPTLTLFSSIGPKSLVDAGVISGGVITLIGVPSPATPCVFLGGTPTTAISSIPQWELLMAYLQQIDAALKAHTHTVAGTTAGPSADYTAASSIAAANLSSIGSLTVKVAP